MSTETKTKPVTIDGNEWSLQETYEGRVLQESMLIRPDGLNFRKVTYQNGAPHNIMLFDKTGASPLMHCELNSRGELEEFFIQEGEKKLHYLNDPENMRVLRMTGKESAKSVDLYDQNDVIVKNGITVSRVARALTSFPGQELKVKSPFDYTITKLSAEGSIDAAHFPSKNGNILESLYFPDGSVQYTREKSKDNTVYQTYPYHGDLKPDATGTRYAHPFIKVVLDPKGELTSLTKRYKGTMKAQYRVSVVLGKDNAPMITEEVFDENGTVIGVRKNTAVKDIDSQDDLVARVKALQGATLPADKAELKTAEALRKLRPAAMPQFHELLEQYGEKIDLKSGQLTIQAKNAPAAPAPAAPSEPVPGDKALTAEAPEDAKCKTTYFKLVGSKPWKLEEHFDDHGVRTQALQFRPDGALYRKIEYKDGELQMVRLYIDDTGKLAQSYSFREDRLSPRIIYNDAHTGEPAEATYFDTPQSLVVVPYSKEGISGPVKQRYMLTGNSPGNVVNHFIKKHFSIAKCVMPVPGVDLGLPEFPQCQVMDLYPNGVLRDVVRQTLKEKDSFRYLFNEKGEAHSFWNITEKGTIIEQTADMKKQEVLVAKLGLDPQGNPKRYTKYYPPIDAKQGMDQQKISLDVTFYEKGGKHFFDITQYNKQGEREPFRSQGKKYNFINEVPIEKWGQKIAIKDMVYQVKYDAQMAHIDRSQTLFDSAPIAAKMKDLLEMPAFEEKVEEAPKKEEAAPQAPGKWTPPESDKFQTIATEIPPTDDKPGYWRVKYFNKGETKSTKTEEFRLNGTLRFREGKTPEGGGNITYFWDETKGDKPVVRSVIRYNNTPYEKWNSHIMLSQVDSSDPVSEEDKAHIKEHALIELGVMMENNRQDVIIDLKHVNTLDAAHVETIRAIEQAVREEPEKPAWEQAVKTVAAGMDAGRARMVFDTVDRPETDRVRAQALKAIMPHIEELEKNSAAPKRMMRLLRSLSKDLADDNAIGASVEEIKELAVAHELDISALKLDALLQKVEVPSDRTEVIAELRRERLNEEADALEAAFAGEFAKITPRKIYFSGVEGRAELADKPGINPSEALKKQMALELGDVRSQILPVYMNGRDPNADDHALECIVRHDEYDTKGRKIYSADFENGKLKVVNGKFQCREFDGSSGKPKPDPAGKLVPKPMVFGDVSVKAGQVRS